MTVTVEDATLEHVFQVIDDVRTADHAEWYAGTGIFFEDAITAVFEDFPEEPKKVALVDGLPVCFWGWDEAGGVWMFATVTAERNAIALHRVLHSEVNKMPPRLVAIADDRNVVHHRWLKWLGFEAIESGHYGPFGLPFTTFTRSAQDV